MNKLVKSKVLYNETEHTYTLGKKKLSGITAIVSWMFPETYSDIPDEVLNKAAIRGHGIHEECQMYNEIGAEPDSEEGKEYVRLLNTNDLTPIASEYVVSDNKSIATPIDVVMSDNSIWDIKSTSSIHWDNVTLQTNICKVLFEKQNKGIKVNRLGVIWLPKAMYGKSEVHELQILDSKIVCKTVQAYIDGEDPAPYRTALFPQSVISASDNVPSEVIQLQGQIIAFEQQVKTMKEKEDELKKVLLDLMEQNNVKKWETDRIILSYIAPTTRISLDSKKLQEEQPETFAKFAKESTVNASIRIKIK